MGLHGADQWYRLFKLFFGDSLTKYTLALMTTDELKSGSPPLEKKVRKGSRARRAVKAVLVAFGCLNVVIGAVGVVIPGLPTTIFLIIALWAFSQSSDRFHKWLYNHRLFGPMLQNWATHGIIPRKAKVLALATMIFSWCMIAYYSTYWIWPFTAGILMGVIGGYILTRPSFKEITNRCDQSVP